MLLITHDGTFHADDVLAHAVLRAIHPAGSTALLRTRDRSSIESATDAIVFDVGDLFDPSARRYDHHMRDKPLREDGTPYSSVGLVWRYHGRDYLASRYPGADAEVIEAIWAHLDARLILPVDAADNGFGASTPDGFAALIDAFNPGWDEEGRSTDEAFLEASAFASRVLSRVCDRAMSSENAKCLVRKAALEAVDPRIIVLPRSMPWEGTVFGDGLRDALYVVFPNEAGVWYCKAVPTERGAFDQRHPLPDEWAGLRNEELAAISGVADAVFCHPGRFICAAASRDGALELAARAIDFAPSRPPTP